MLGESNSLGEEKRKPKGARHVSGTVSWYSSIANSNKQIQNRSSPPLYNRLGYWVGATNGERNKDAVLPCRWTLESNAVGV